MEIVPIDSEYHENRKEQFYDVWVTPKGHVWFRVKHQSFRLSHEPTEADLVEGIDGHGIKHSQWLARQLKTALDRMRTGIN